MDIISVILVIIFFTSVVSTLVFARLENPNSFYIIMGTMMITSILLMMLNANDTNDNIGINCNGKLEIILEDGTTVVHQNVENASQYNFTDKYIIEYTSGATLQIPYPNIKTTVLTCQESLELNDNE